ncbi:MAG: hypothetical protein WC326_00925 [Candidatus Delongbacteria bacterium]
MLKPFLRNMLHRVPIALNPFEAPYRAFLRRLGELESLSVDEIRHQQLVHLQQLVQLAYDKTDFYRETYDRAGVHPRDLRSLRDLECFPIVSKDDVRAQGSRMLRRGLDPLKLGTVSTSGTTGSPLTLWVDAQAAARERAAIHYQWKRVGFHPGAGRIELRGIFEGDGLWQDLPSQKALRVNINRLEAQELPQIIQAMNACPYSFLHGYPHAVERFARLLEEEGRVGQLRHPRAILLGSEAVLESQWTRIRRAFPDSPVIAHYGMAERVALGAWVDERRDTHFLPGYSVVEVDGEGCLIGTSLINEAMPLIRYRTTDVLGDYSPEPTTVPHLFPVAGRIEGRRHDMLRRTNGDFLSPVMANHALLAGEGFGACQIIQHALDRLELLVEPEGPDERVRACLPAVQTRLREVFGPDLQVTLTLTPRIPREAGGKFKWVVSKL